jgi:hypothetical protein
MYVYFTNKIVTARAKKPEKERKKRGFLLKSLFAFSAFAVNYS